MRNTKAFRATFNLRARPTPAPVDPLPDLTLPPLSSKSDHPVAKSTKAQQAVPPVAAQILNPVYRRTALVKLQGPFTDRQLDSVCKGLVYLEKLGLVSVIVVELDDWIRGDDGEKVAVTNEVNRVVSALESQGARARPILQSVVRLGPKPLDTPLPDNNLTENNEIPIPEAHTLPHDLNTIRSTLRAGEIPVLPPLALDSFCRTVRIHSNDVIGALAKGMVEAGNAPINPSQASADDVDLTPLRLMIINREGGIPSYARSGLPHLLVNLTAEHKHIHDTFHESWATTNPTSLGNVALARTCLEHMPPSSSAIMVSHRSPSSLIGNLITNKPELSSSLPHALLQTNRKLSPATPTIMRRGLPIRVVNKASELDRGRLSALLEDSFNRNLDEEAYYKRLEERLDFAIVAGDYAGAAIVTNEGPLSSPDRITYLDKFAVDPMHQGDGTVDFLWVALHDESYGLGLPFSANPNGGKGGEGNGTDLVWRSRADNPVNKWYFERASGHVRIGKWVMFWCDAEKRLKIEEGRRGFAGLSFAEEWERGRLSYWGKHIDAIPSAWT